MHRIDSVGSVNGFWDPGDPATGKIATRHDFEFQNAFQEELIGLLEYAGVTPEKGNWGQVLQAILSIRAAGEAGGGLRNFCHNSTFHFWQRGQSFSLPDPSSPDGSRYLADRWRGFPGDSGAATITQEQKAVGTGYSTSGSTRYLRWLQTTDGTNAAYLEQRMPLDHMHSREVTFSAELRSSGPLSVVPVILYDFREGNGVRQFRGAQWTTNVKWDRFSFTATLPSHVGQDIQPGAYWAVRIEMPDGSGWWLDVDNVMVEDGPIAAAYVAPPRHLDLSACQYYYTQSYGINTAPGTVTQLGEIHIRKSSGTNSVFGCKRTFPVYMRRSPDMVMYDPSSGVPGRVWFNGSWATVVTIIQNLHGLEYITIDNSSNGELRAHFTADAEM